MFSEDSRQVIDRPAALAWAFYGSISNFTTADQNIAVSPFSLDMPLTIAYTGAIGRTQTEIGDFLGIGHVKEFGKRSY